MKARENECKFSISYKFTFPLNYSSKQTGNVKKKKHEIVANKERKAKQSKWKRFKQL